MNIHGYDIGVCSWSLKPRSIADLILQVGALELSHIQLALGELLTFDNARRQSELAVVRASGLILTATMINFPGEDYSSIVKIRASGGFVPEKAWRLRKERTLAAGRLSAELGVPLLTTHIGFVPPPREAGYVVILGRVREIATALAADGITLLLETGQESAAELHHFLEDLRAPNVAVNFDPANMILYGAGDPIEAIAVLAKYIRHVHVKDAAISPNPGEIWGKEVPFGEGQVDPGRFLQALKKAGYRGPLVIEREAGDSNAADVKKAIAALRHAAMI